VVISNGSVERYKHPRSVTLRAYATIPDPPVVLQTNKCFHPAPCANVPDEFIADAEPGEHDGTILIRTMDGATNTYTVSYDSMTRTFKVKASAGSTSISSVVRDRESAAKPN